MHKAFDGVFRELVGGIIFRFDFFEYFVNFRKRIFVAVKIYELRNLARNARWNVGCGEVYKQARMRFIAVVGFMYNAIGDKHYITRADFVNLVINKIIAAALFHIVNLKKIMIVARATVGNYFNVIIKVKNLVWKFHKHRLLKR